MRRDLDLSSHIPSSAMTWRVWAGSRLAAAMIGIGLVWALFYKAPFEIVNEPAPILSVFTMPADLPRQRRPDIAVPLSPPPTPLKVPISQPEQGARPSQQTKSTNERATPIIDRAQSTVVSPPAVATLKLIAPNNAIAPSAKSDTAPTPSPALSSALSPVPNQNSGGETSNGRLTSRTLGILRARECARLDVRDRPTNCPPNDELMRLLAQEREPTYRPEKAEGFSRNEIKWRGIPPPCLQDGKNVSVSGIGACIRFGNTPSRVRSVREICEAKGLGGCADTPTQAAVNAALQQIGRQSEAKLP